MFWYLKHLLCRHDRVYIARWHPAVRRPYMVGKSLYTDVHNVENYVRCSNCGKFLDVEHRVTLHPPLTGAGDQ